MPPVALPAALGRYYAGLDAGDVVAACSAFAEDATYVRASLRNDAGDPDLGVIRGRAALLEFLLERGPRPWRHEPRTWVVDGAECFLEGSVTGGGPLDYVFLARATLTGDGLISRYIAVGGSMSAPIVVAAEQAISS